MRRTALFLSLVLAFTAFLSAQDFDLSKTASTLLKLAYSGAIQFRNNADGAFLTALQAKTDGGTADSLIVGGSGIAKTCVASNAGNGACVGATQGLYVGAASGTDKGVGTINAVGYYSDGTAGATVTVSVRNGADSGACNIVFKAGIFISTTCP